MKESSKMSASKMNLISASVTILKPNFGLMPHKNNAKQLIAMHDTGMPQYGDKPSEDQITSGYEQVYIVKKETSTAPRQLREVFFGCGNWCYDGFASFDFLERRDMTITDLGRVAPLLQKSQDDLSFVCTADSVLSESKSFAPAFKLVHDAHDFLANELGNPSIIERVTQEGQNAFDDGHYFELVADIPSNMDDVECICAKVYTKGLCLVSFYFDGIFYTVLQRASDKIPLLDIHFPDISGEGNGLTLALYDSSEDEDSERLTWRKLSLWQSVVAEDRIFDRQDVQTVSLSCSAYTQSYCVLKPNKADRSLRDVLFRFGSWCYSGQAKLVPSLLIEDIHYVIPALRTQQHNLSFLCHASDMSKENIFTKPLMYVAEISNIMEREVIASENAIETIQKKGQSALDINADPSSLFFEFETSGKEQNILEQSHIDCIATKSYRPNGLIVMNIYYRGTFYVCMSSGEDNQPLLDSEFPSIVRGKGYKLKTFCGVDGWPELRKLSLWRNVESPVLNVLREEELSEQAEDKLDHPITSDRNEEHDVETKLEVKVMKEQSDPVKVDTKHVEGETTMEARVHSLEQDKYTNIAESKSDHEQVPPTSSPKKRTITANRNKQNLGAFHHLAPLKKSSKLADQLRQNKNQPTSQVPWDSEGKPVSK